jgi:hypothetical protein
MPVSEAFPGVVDESVQSMDLPNGTNRFHLEPRCRICRNDQVRTKVNDLLATEAIDVLREIDWDDEEENR